MITRDFSELARSLNTFGISSAPPPKRHVSQAAKTSRELGGVFERPIMMGEKEIGVIGLAMKGRDISDVSHIGGRASTAEIVGVSVDTLKLALSFYVKPGEDIDAYRFDRTDGLVRVTADETIPFEVPIRWTYSEEHNRKIPNITSGKRDYHRIFFVDKHGKFRFCNVFVASRTGRFYLGIQVMVAGHLLAVPGKNAIKAEQAHTLAVAGVTYSVRVAPTTMADAYLNFNPFLSFYEEMKPFAAQMIADGRYGPVADGEVSLWEFPQDVAIPQKYQRKGYTPAVVQFYDVHKGIGKLLLADGTILFLHFSTAFNTPASELLCLRSGQHLAVKYTTENKFEVTDFRCF